MCCPCLARFCPRGGVRAAAAAAQPLFPRGASAPGCAQHGAAGTIQRGLIRWDELPGSVQHESVAADRGVLFHVKKCDPPPFSCV